MHDEDSIECFFLIPTNKYRVSLRRYRSKGPSCRGNPKKRCQSSSPFCIIPNDRFLTRDDCPELDLHWPQLCATCGFPFDEESHEQIAHEQVYLWQGTRIELTRTEAPPGAIWDASWLEGIKDPGPDGQRLYVRLPDGVDWYIDGPTKSGSTVSGWTRTGIVPNLTVTPSVKTSSWEGSLIKGRLVPTKR